MYFRRIKIGNILLVLLILYLFGYTSWLGGPFGLARFFFVLIILGTLVFWLVVFGIMGFAKRIFQKRMSGFRHQTGEENEKIKVDAKVIE